MEHIGNTLRSVKEKTNNTKETAQAGVNFIGGFLGHIAASISVLDEYAAALPSDETLDTLVDNITKIQDETLDAYSILNNCSQQTGNTNIVDATSQTQHALGSLGAPDTSRWKEAPSALSSAHTLRDKVRELQSQMAALKTLANETGSMYQNMSGDVQKAVAEGDGAVAEITVYQQERGLGA